MEKEYLEIVIRPYGDKFTSLDYNNTNFKVGTIEDYNGYNYDRYGWTNLIYEPQENDYIFFVEVDMHS